MLDHEPATPSIHTLSLHDALPILQHQRVVLAPEAGRGGVDRIMGGAGHQPDHGGRLGSRAHGRIVGRSEEHTSELQSRGQLVCRLLLEKKKHLSYICGRTYQMKSS